MVRRERLAGVLTILSSLALGGCAFQVKALRQDKLDDGFSCVAVMGFKLIDRTRSVGAVDSIPITLLWYPQATGEQGRSMTVETVPSALSGWREAQGARILDGVLIEQCQPGRLFLPDLALNDFRGGAHSHVSLDVWQETWLTSGSLICLGTLTVELNAFGPVAAGGTPQVAYDYTASISHDLAADAQLLSAFRERFPGTSHAFSKIVEAEWHPAPLFVEGRPFNRVAKPPR
jgi:hypothetical protein